MADDKGQTDGTPTVETKTTGQESAAASPGSENLTDKVLAAAAGADEKVAAEKAAAEKTAAEKAAAGKVDDKSGDGKEKPAPYDQDPKWKEARAAQAKYQKILDKHDLDEDSLEDALASGLSISEILGVRDAKTLTETIQQLKKDSDYLKEVKAYWAEQEEQKKKEELTPEQRAEMSESKLKAYEKDQAAKKAQTEQEASIKQALESYTEQVDKVIESSGFEDEDATIAKLFLGVDNPFNEVDITDKKAVREMVKTNTVKFKTFLDNVRQKAVDEYAKGKSKIVPITKVETSGNETVTKKKIPEDATVDQVFAMAHDEMLEIIANMPK